MVSENCQASIRKKAALITCQAQSVKPPHGSKSYRFSCSLIFFSFFRFLVGKLGEKKKDQE